MKDSQHKIVHGQIFAKAAYVLPYLKEVPWLDFYRNISQEGFNDSDIPKELSFSKGLEKRNDSAFKLWYLKLCKMLVLCTL